MSAASVGWACCQLGLQGCTCWAWKVAACWRAVASSCLAVASALRRPALERGGLVQAGVRGGGGDVGLLRTTVTWVDDVGPVVAGGVEQGGALEHLAGLPEVIRALMRDVVLPDM